MFYPWYCNIYEKTANKKAAGIARIQFITNKAAGVSGSRLFFFNLNQAANFSGPYK
jgi:hypothetical protein